MKQWMCGAAITWILTMGVVASLARAQESSEVDEPGANQAEGAPSGAAEHGAADGKGVVEQGQGDLDEAMRLRVTSQGLEEGRLAEGLRDLNQVIELLESALDKGLDDDNQQFAEQLLSESLLERSSSLMEVLRRRPSSDPRMQQLQRMATSDLRRVLAGADAPASARLMLAQLLAGPEGDVHESRRLLAQFLSDKHLSDDERAEALALRARLHNDRDKALQDFDEAIRLAPDNSSYSLARAAYLRGRNEPEQALADVVASLEKSPDDPAALLLQGEILRELGQLDEALAIFDQLTALAPQALEPYQNRGEIYREQGDHKQAIKEFTQILQVRPGILLTLLHRAEAYLLDGQSKAALADVEAALQQQPGLVAAHRLRAQALASEERLGEAVEEMKQLAAALPEDVDVRMQLALYYQFDKQPVQAIAAYTDALARDKDNVTALRHRGDAYLSIGEHLSAVADLQRAAELSPDDSGILNNLAWVMATSPLDEVRNGDKAVATATKACELSEFKKAHILSTLAAAYAETGDFEKARQLSQQAIDTSDPEVTPELKEALQKELDSYRDNKPWREKQTVDQPQAPEESATPPAQAAPAPSEKPPAQSFDF